MEGDSQGGSRVFSVRIVSIDYYMAPPIPELDIYYSSFQGETVKEVPVIRVYGSTPAGQKACVHIHRALPYLYIPYSDIPHQSNINGDASKNALLLALEKALKLKGNAGAKRQHVHGCSIVRARKLYGYHSSEELFMKLYLYHPHDVARAASLLLGGAIFEKSLQPHESHIPFLLQFLVDYNLYGMGLLHLIKMKFRQPVPADVFRVKANHINSDDMADSQADTSCRSSSVSQVWTTSTIPDGWVWQYSGKVVSSQDQNIQLVLRQSTSELEGDTTVDDILNQQFKMYTSCSQTCSDVRMVQSLVPIWEEEYERSGVHPIGMLPDSGKPQPEDVLKTLSVGLECNHKLQELWAEEKWSVDIDVSLGCQEGSDMGIENQDQKGQALRCSKSIDAAQQCLPPDSVCCEVDGTSAADGRATCSDLAEVTSTPKMVEELDHKAADLEAVSLLKWFASSQAAEDINSDDELLRDTILNPLLPAAFIDKVIEKASVDFESESQQECRDILDSVEDVNIEHLKEKAFPISLRKIAPEMHVSGDVKLSTGATNSSEVQMDMKSTSKQCVTLEDPGSGFQSKVKTKKSSCLPLFVAENVQSDVHVACMNANDGSRTDTDRGSSPLARHEVVNDSNSVSKDKRPLLGCSVRELMRKKRCHRVGPLEQGDTRARGGPIEELKGFHKNKLEFHAEQLANQELHNLKSPNCDNLQVRLMEPCEATPYAATDSISEASLDSPPSSVTGCAFSYLSKSDAVRESDLHVADTPSSHICTNKPAKLSQSLTTPYDEGKTFDRGSYADDIGHECGMSVELSPEIVSENLGQMEAAIHKGSHELSAKQQGAFGCGKLISSCREMRGKEPLEYIGAALKKPLAVDITSQTSGREENDYDQVNGNRNPSIRSWNFHQNDGTYCCMLTPALSPPSIDSVHQWLSLQENGSFIEDVDAGLNEPSYVGGSMESPADSREKLFSEFTPVCSLAPTLKTNDENHGSPSSGKSDEMAVAMQVEQGKGDVTAVAMQDEQGILKLEDKTQTSQDNSQISGPSWRSPLTPLSQLGFRDPASVGRGQQLTLISIEVQAECRGDLRPDPHFDAINIVTMAIENDDPNSEVHVLLRSSTNSCCRNIDGVSGCNVLAFPEEKDLVNHFAKIMCSFDPDIIMGWDVQGGSLGFLAERSSILGVCLLNKISRTPSVIKIDEGLEKGNEDAMVSGHLVTNPIVHGEPVIEDEWGRTHASGVHVGGRIVLNVWRLIRGEVKLNMYTVEAVVEAVLRRKLPSIQLTVLNKWFLSGQGRARYKCIDYMAERAKLNIEIVNTLDMINRTSELARVFGIDFFSVLSRGSQYRVESMLIRLAHAQNYVAISPGYEQVACQPAMECLPLVMEPESGFYTDPVIVLDFQSLYPSIIIAYNLCFCTCLGKIVPSKADVLGVSIYSPDLQVLRKLNQEILVTPNGVMYVPSKVRKGVLPRLLEEILSTRVMVKQAMKSLTSPQQILHRIFNARQLALKLIANVTYGYTAAGFSGRMPCAELADSIVQCGRRTLENAISVVNGHDKWKARVIYGDTDSMFVLVEGRSLCEAFQIGQEIASTITAMNPNPVTLKMEKVYQPCFLLTKKRYVGYSYESPEQVEPIFDAKGIETVRRDTCGAVAKILEKTLRLFFEHQDISEIKAYLQRQWSRILSGRVSLQDFVFSKEVRLGTYSTRASSSVPPAAIVATKAMRADPRAEPRYGERVPYVVIHGEPGARLVDMVVDPLDLLAIDSPYRLNDLYYIKKQIIPALQRVFGLVGADLNRWFLEMPRPVRDAPSKRHFDPLNPQRTRIDYYYSSQHCVLCGDLVQAGRHLCEQCSKKGAAGAAAAAVTGRTSKLERDIQHLAAICRHCGGGDWIVESGVKCTSLACPVFYERRKVQKELRALSAIAAEEGLYPKCMIEWF